jgi:hypothetical protein
MQHMVFIWHCIMYLLTLTHTQTAINHTQTYILYDQTHYLPMFNINFKTTKGWIIFDDKILIVI